MTDQTTPCPQCGAHMDEPCDRRSGQPCAMPTRPHHPGQWVNPDDEGDDDR